MSKICERLGVRLQVTSVCGSASNNGCSIRFPFTEYLGLNDGSTSWLDVYRSSFPASPKLSSLPHWRPKDVEDGQELHEDVTKLVSFY